MPKVELSNPDRVLFPDDGITKGDLFAYYAQVAPALVPHLRDRPFTMKRFREGIVAPGFFQKQAPKGMPAWIETRRFTEGAYGLGMIEAEQKPDALVEQRLCAAIAGCDPVTMRAETAERGRALHVCLAAGWGLM